MTLILGIKCGDGIVVGADSMFAVGSHFGRVRMDGEKIHLLPNNRGIVAFAGDLDVSQFVLDDLREQWSAIRNSESRNEVKDLISDSIRRVLGDENDQLDRPEFSALVALPIQKQASLLLFRGTQRPKEASDGNYILRAGTGDHFALLFQKFLDHVFWNGKAPPSISDGVFSALWTLNYIIETNAMGVGGAPRIALLEKTREQETLRSRMLPNHELDEYQQLVESIESAMRQIKESWNQP
ncbi:MAG: hypothetical protein OXB89_00720 [Anaerolineaceae bacterium]|nr:hypothetical protein [Anaerolineaceae bacterium]